ncbi:protoporphyrinogen oxidase HemJ [Arcobacteraceae bacterium]|nr:protoporphyrinogen oxidase HemJ [Arcobacteraceae bacterium]
MNEYYLPILAFHVISVLSWMALLFYLPRLFVYHSENKDKKEFVEIVKIQELKIYKIIGFPAMIATIISGVTLVVINPTLLSQPWFHAKLALLVLLIAYSFSLEYYRKKLVNDSCNKSGKFFRAYNEIPTLLAILIVTFVITKNIPIIFSIGITLFFAFIIYMIMRKNQIK